MVSQENLERVEGIMREWAAGNWFVGADLIAADVVMTGAVPEGDVVSEGLEAVVSFLQEFLGQWERYWVEPWEFIDLGEKILVIGRQYGIGATSGVRVEEPWYAVFTFRDDRVVGLNFTPDRRAGLAVAGLEE